MMSVEAVWPAITNKGSHVTLMTCIFHQHATNPSFMTDCVHYPATYQVPPAASTCVCWWHADIIYLRVISILYGFCHPYEANALKLRLSACVDDVSLWMTSNRLQLNLWCASARRQQQIPVGQVCIGDTFVCPVRAVRDLGVHLDADMSMTAHVRATVRSCFAALRQIRSVHHSL